MKAQIHPKWYEAKVHCACGNDFTVGSTVQEITVDVCSNCHPFYTGQMKYLDAAGRVDAFRARMQTKSEKVVSKADRRAAKRLKKIEAEISRPESLEELRKQVKSQKKSDKVQA